MSRKPSVAVFGASGVVGGNMAAFLTTKACLFSKLALHDINPGTKYRGAQDDFVTTDRKEDAMGCDIAFVCVPTPERADGSADTSIVEDVCSWGGAGVFVVRSTVPPGTCEEIVRRTGRDIVFQPEYLGENPSGNAYNDIGDRKWVTLGGPREATMKAAAFYTRLYPADCRIMQTDFRTAEMVKYMTNTFLAMKTVYCAEMECVCEAHGVDYMAARELWLLDERIGRSHTSVYRGNRGYAGKCLPKDTAAIIRSSEKLGFEPKLLKAVDARNDELRAQAGLGTGADQLA
jgi:UDPglucose 6-dehydrogenase